MPEGLSLLIIPPIKPFGRPTITLQETVVVSGEILERGTTLHPFFSRIPPELLNVLLHSHERNNATSLRQRWEADIKLIRGMGTIKTSFIKRLLVACGVFPHSLYRTIQLFFKG